MKPSIRIDFCDFWQGFNKEDNYFTRLLSTNYNVELSDNPDFLIYSVFGLEYLKYKCIRIFYTGENIRPDFRECDFALGFDCLENDNHFRLPIYMIDFDDKLREDPSLSLFNKKDIEKIERTKTKFCGFLVNNPNAKERVSFFKKLSEYKKVDSGGKVLRNIDGPYQWTPPLKFLAPYKFNICFENTSYPGYTTEKLTNAMLANCIPIYWGDPLVHKVFNTKSFINIQDYSNYKEAIEHIIEIDNNEAMYREYLEQPYLLGSKESFLKRKEVLSFFDSLILEKEKIQPIANHLFYSEFVWRWRIAQKKYDKIFNPQKVYNY